MLADLYMWCRWNCPVMRMDNLKLLGNTIVRDDSEDLVFQQKKAAWKLELFANLANNIVACASDWLTQVLWRKRSPAHYTFSAYVT